MAKALRCSTCASWMARSRGSFASGEAGGDAASLRSGRFGPRPEGHWGQGCTFFFAASSDVGLMQSKGFGARNPHSTLHLDPGHASRTQCRAQDVKQSLPCARDTSCALSPWHGVDLGQGSTFPKSHQEPVLFQLARDETHQAQLLLPGSSFRT